MDPARISFSTAITLNSHNRNNRVLKEKLATLYFDLLYRYWVVRENYVLTQALTPQPYRLVRRMPFDLPAVRSCSPISVYVHDMYTDLV